MVRSVFFSFHYQRDIMRVQVVKNHYITKGNYTAAGFFDGSLEEKSQREGDAAVKRLIDTGLKGTSVTCVLIGYETYKRRWVDYEILKASRWGMVSSASVSTRSRISVMVRWIAGVQIRFHTLGMVPKALCYAR